MASDNCCSYSLDFFTLTKMIKKIFHLETRELFKSELYMKFCVVAFYFVSTSILTPLPHPFFVVMLTLVSVNFQVFFCQTTLTYHLQINLATK